MTVLLGTILLITCLAWSKAEFALTAPHDVTGTWRDSVTLPCAYHALDHTQEGTVWLFNDQRVFYRDDTGDHVIVTRYRDRLSLPEDRKGSNVSLTIVNLQIDDSGWYTCKVSLRLPGTSGLITKEAKTHLDVRKVAVTTPVTRPEGSLFKVSEGGMVRFTCSAEGSPPITYRWYKRGTEGTSDLLLTRGSYFIIESAQTSHSGSYYCEVENKIPAKKTQRSQEFQLHVTDAAVSTTTNPKVEMGSTERMTTAEQPQRTSGHEPHYTGAPSSTKGDSGRRTPHSTETPKTIIRTIATAGTKGRTQTTGTPGKQTPADNKAPTSASAPSVSSGSALPLIITVIVLCLALLVILAAVLVTRCRRRKGTDGIYEIPTMSELNARATRDVPIVNVCQMNICPINGLENNSCLSSDMPALRKPNDYQPVRASSDQKPNGDRQGPYTNCENEYEKLLTER